MGILRLRFFIWLWLLFCLVLPYSLVSAQFPAHIDTAVTYFGFQDEPGKNNHGQNIKIWLNYTGLPEGNPYCSAFVSYCLGVSGSTKPKTRSALSSRFIQNGSISAKHVMQGRESVPSGTIIVWRRGNTQFGHVGFVLFDWRGSTGITIEANTTTGTGGNEFNGSGVWIRKRTIFPLNHFRITHFTLVKYV